MTMSERHKRQHFIRTIWIGLFGGMFMIFFSYFLYIFNFIELSPKVYLVYSWTKASWANRWVGEIVTMILSLILSMISALIYDALFKKLLSVILSAFYGIALWLILGYVSSFIAPNIPILHSLNSDTIFSSFCLFILYGTFIGYSISFDYRQSVVH